MIGLFPARCWAGWFSNQNEQRSLVLHLLSILGNSFGSSSVRYQANTDSDPDSIDPQRKVKVFKQNMDKLCAVIGFFSFSFLPPLSSLQLLLALKHYLGQP